MRHPQRQSEMLPRIFVSRPRLVGRLFQITRCKLTVLCAEAGYGKTTLATEFAWSAGLRTEWCHLTRAHLDIAQLAEALGESLWRLATKPEARTPRRAPAHRPGAPSLAVLTEALLRRAARVGPETALLFLDDYQNVDQEADANLLLQSLIEGSPPYLHFILLSRTEPRFPVARLRARQELSIVGAEELAFTLEETSQFLREQSELDLEDEAIALVQERTEGWAAGVAMVSQSLSYGSRDKVMAVLADPATSAWLVYDYLAEEVFDRQLPTTQDFLLKTSILGVLNAPVCNQLLGIVSSQVTLVGLEAAGLFTTRVDHSKRAFRYHQLFREFLRQKLYQRESQETVRALHLKAAEIYEREEAWDGCVNHYLKAGEPVKAAQAVEAFRGRYTLYGFHKTLEYWLRVLPEELTMARPWLLALRGQLGTLSGRFEEAIRCLERASRLFRASGDQEGQVWTVGVIAVARLGSGQLQQSIRHFASSVEMAQEGSLLKSWLVVNQAKAYRDAGMLEASAAGCRLSLAELAEADDDKDVPWWRSRALSNLARTQVEMGNLEAARHSVEQALAIGSVHQVGEEEECWVSITHGIVLWACGALQESLQALTRALSLSGQCYGSQRSSIGLWMGNTLRDLGRYSEAHEAYGWNTREAEIERLFLAVLTRRAQSRTAAPELYSRHHLSEVIPLRSAAEVVLSAVLREGHEPGEALEHVREGVRLLRAHGCRLRLASALLHQARLEYELLSLSEARGSLAQALELAVAGGYYHFFWWDPELVAFLCPKALAENLFADYVAELMVRRLGRAGAGVLAPLLHDGRAEVRRRAQSLLSSLRRRGAMDQREEVLAECADLCTRSALATAIADQLISPEGVRRLRGKHCLSWREVEILVEYYLRPAAQPEEAATTLRKWCAQRLHISENTVRHHVNNLRGKLALPVSVSGKQVLNWAEREGLLQRPGSASLLQQALPQASVPFLHALPADNGTWHGTRVPLIVPPSDLILTSARPAGKPNR